MDAVKTLITIQVEAEFKMGVGSARGTHLVGYLPDFTTYDQLIKIFGQPQLGESQDGKVKAEWVGELNGLVFTIYDYKSDFDIRDNTDWHIGGKEKIVSEMVNQYFIQVRNRIFPKF